MSKSKLGAGYQSNIETWMEQQLQASESIEFNQDFLDKYNFIELHSGNPPTIKIKRFNKDSYNGPRVEDFIRRLDALNQTAVGIIGQSDLTQVEKTARVKKLGELRTKAETEIKNNCQIDAIKLDELLQKEEEVTATILRATGYFQDYMAETLALIYPQLPLRESSSLFQTAEAEWTRHQGRPNFINQYQVMGENDRFSVQQVNTQDIIPSTKRDEGRITNFSQVATGSIDSEGKMQVDFTGFRHSSLPPIKVKDKIERRALTCEAAKDLFAELAKKQLEADHKEPLELRLSSMALLSAIKGDKVFLSNESEHRQLKESQYALMMYHGREIELTIDNQKVKVKPIINLMNAPSNVHGIASKQVQKRFTLVDNLEVNINERGFYQYVSDSNAYLNVELEKLKNPELEASDPELYAIIEDYEKINTSESEELKEALKELKRTENIYSLTKRYEKLETLQNELRKLPKNSDNYIIKKAEYKAEVIEIRKIENELSKAYHRVNTEREKIWNNNASDYIALQDKLSDYLSNAKKNKNPEKQDAIRTLQVMQLFHQSEALYYRNNALPHEFASRYLLVNERMGNAVSWFCKSGEDRTGRLNNFIEELCAFSDVNGYFPRYDFQKSVVNKTDRQMQQEMALSVNAFSIASDVCDANAHGARGIQQSETGLECNKGLPNKCYNANAKLAKSPFRKDKLVKLWQESLDPSAQKEEQFVSELRRLTKDHITDLKSKGAPQATLIMAKELSEILTQEIPKEANVLISEFYEKLDEQQHQDKSCRTEKKYSLSNLFIAKIAVLASTMLDKKVPGGEMFSKLANKITGKTPGDLIEIYGQKMKDSLNPSSTKNLCETTSKYRKECFNLRAKNPACNEASEEKSSL